MTRGEKTGRGNGASRGSGWRAAWGSAVTAEAQGSGLKSGRVKFLGGCVGMGWGHLQAVGRCLEPWVGAQEGLDTGQPSGATHRVPAFLQVSPGQTRAGDPDDRGHRVYLTVPWACRLIQGNGSACDL